MACWNSLSYAASGLLKSFYSKKFGNWESMSITDVPDWIFKSIMAFDSEGMRKIELDEYMDHIRTQRRGGNVGTSEVFRRQSVLSRFCECTHPS